MNSCKTRTRHSLTVDITIMVLIVPVNVRADTRRGNERAADVSLSFATSNALVAVAV